MLSNKIWRSIYFFPELLILYLELNIMVTIFTSLNEYIS